MTLTWAKEKEREREKGKIETMIDSSDTRVQKVRDPLSEAMESSVNNPVFQR
jgi:hypothetical protein